MFDFVFYNFISFNRICLVFYKFRALHKQNKEKIVPLHFRKLSFGVCVDEVEGGWWVEWIKFAIYVLFRGGPSPIAGESRENSVAVKADEVIPAST